MTEDRGYYAIIPASVRYDSRVPATAKLIYGEITALCNEKGYCWASNKYFADLYGVSKVTISRHIKTLCDCGYITSNIEQADTGEITRRLIRLKREEPDPQEDIDNEADDDWGGINKNDKGVLTEMLRGINKNDKGVLTKMLRGINKNVKYNNTINNTNNITSNTTKKKAGAALIDSLIAQSPLPDSIKDALGNWAIYKEQLGMGYQEAGMVALLSQTEKAFEDIGERSVVECFNTSMANNWKGVFFDPPKSNSHATVDDTKSNILGPEHRRIMQALGFTRNATEKELAMMNSWMDEMGCSMEEVLDACGQTSKISKPNFSYVDAVIRNRKGLSKKEAPTSVVTDYYAKLREEAMERVRIAKEQVIEKVPSYGVLSDEADKIIRDMVISIGSGNPENLAKMQQRIATIEKEQAQLLAENNIPDDYMMPHYACPLCEDTGMLIDGSRCSCYKERAKEAAAQTRGKMVG